MAWSNHVREAEQTLSLTRGRSWFGLTACDTVCVTEQPPPDAEQQGTAPAVEPEPGLVTETPAELRARRRRRAKLYSWAFLLGAFLVVLVALIVANTRSVKISWVVDSTHTSLIWIIIVSALLGWFSGLVTSILFQRSTRRRRK
jgi:uncharacterized integral membrane protein